MLRLLANGKTLFNYNCAIMLKVLLADCHCSLNFHKWAVVPDVTVAGVTGNSSRYTAIRNLIGQNGVQLLLPL